MRFKGWTECGKTNDGGIKITVEDERPWSILGNCADSETQSMLLNFTFGNFQKTRCKSNADQCIWSIAIHEFGHALGLLHEQDSPNTEEWCKAKHIGTAPANFLKAKILTDWDASSVMNYCFDIYSHRAQLSDCDIAGYHEVYKPARPPQYKPKCNAR